LAEAFARLASEDDSVRLLLVGDGEEAILVRTILDRAGALDAVHMPGVVPRPEVPGYLAAADVLVSPHAPVDRFIGSPVKIFEYMASGRAIVASRLAQIGELLRDGETALLVPPGDPLRLQEALRRLKDDPELRERLGRAAQEEARSQHSWDARLTTILDDEPPG
jgi:glycosyltransferase involved in cell wall biosynthesis